MAETIAERIRALREERGWSKVELGRRVGVKNGRVTVHRWETGQVVPSPANVAILAEAFGVPQNAVDPSGSAYQHTRPRTKSHEIDNTAELGKIPPSPPTTTTEGLMRDQVERLKGALLQIPAEHRERFARQVSVLAARMLLELEDAGVMPGKQRRVAGKG